MNLQKGLNRIFILLGIVAAVFGCMLGSRHAATKWKPSFQEAFQSINWNDQENISQYYFTAEYLNESETKRHAEVKNYPDTPLNRQILRELEPRVKTEDLPNYKKVPPQYNKAVFYNAFPDKLYTPVYKLLLGLVGGALLAFCICYGGLHSIRLVIKWIISGFSYGKPTSNIKR